MMQTRSCAAALRRTAIFALAGVLAACSQVKTVQSDDPLLLSASNYAVAQDAGAAVVTVNRGGSASSAASVNYGTVDGTAVAGDDYTVSSGTLVWSSGDAASKTISIPISNSTAFSGTKVFTITLSAPNGATLGTPSSATITITGSTGTGVGTVGSLELSSGSYAATQTGGTATITVDRSGADSGAVGVAYATANGTAVAGTDYTASGGTLQWAAGDTVAKTFTVPVSSAYPFAGTKAFTVALSDPSGGASLGSPASASVTITGDSASAVGSLQLSNTSYSVIQGAGTATITVTRAGGTNGDVGVAYSTANGTAVAGTDYTSTSGTLPWTNGDAASKTFSVPINGAPAFAGVKLFTVSLAAPTGGATLGSPTHAPVSIGGAGGSGAGSPSAVTNFTLVAQGGPNNATAALTNYQALSWTAATAGVNPIDHYQIFRNGVPYATTTKTTYADTAATGANDPTWATAATAYVYQIAALDSAGNIGPQASQLSTWFYHNGVRYSSQDLSYGGVKSNYQSTAGNPQGGMYDISVYFNNGGFLPVMSPPQAPVDDLEVGAFGYMTLDINPGSPVVFNGTPRIGMLSRLPPGDVGPWKGANLFEYGPTPVANTWATYKIPLADLGIGLCTFTGSITGSILIVTSVQSGCVGVDGGGFVSGPNVPAKTYILGFGQENTIGTFTLGGPGIKGNTSVSSETMVYQRTAIYKFNITIPNEAPTMYLNNIGWTVN